MRHFTTQYRNLLLLSFAAFAFGPAPACSAQRGDEPAPHADSPAEHADDDHAAHDGREAVRLTPAEIAEFGLVIAEAEPGTLERTIAVPGEIRPNEDALAHIVPRVPGVVREVHAHWGDVLEAGALLAVLDSRELAEAKAAYLAARERLALARATLRRESDLWDKRLSSEQEYLDARQAEAEARIALKTATQHLYALGLSKETVAALPEADPDELKRYDLRAPFAGTIIDKHITLGEAVGPDTPVFTIADLGTVWVNLSIFPEDLTAVRAGQPVIVNAGSGLPEAHGQIFYYAPVVDETTRTATARVRLPNPNGQWRPGTFVRGTILVERADGGIVLPRSALQTIDGAAVIFVETPEGFAPREVVVAREAAAHVELRGGLVAGERFVAAGASTLKFELEKAGFESGHAH